MASLQSMASSSSSPVSHNLPHSASNKGKVVLPIFVSCLSNGGRIQTGGFGLSSSISCSSSFKGQSVRVQCQRLRMRKCEAEAYGSAMNVMMVMVQPKIQFIQGTDELTVPDVRLTKSRDGTNGVAIFRFEQPSVFDSSAEVGDITGFYMIDEEGVIQSVDVNAKFINGKPAGIEAKYVMRTPKDWDRFMRFMERYSNANGLQFIKK